MTSLIIAGKYTTGCGAAQPARVARRQLTGWLVGCSIEWIARRGRFVELWLVPAGFLSESCFEDLEPGAYERRHLYRVWVESGVAIWPQVVMVSFGLAWRPSVLQVMLARR